MIIPSDLASCLRGHIQFPDGIWVSGGWFGGGMKQDEVVEEE